MARMQEKFIEILFGCGIVITSSSSDPDLAGDFLTFMRLSHGAEIDAALENINASRYNSVDEYNFAKEITFNAKTSLANGYPDLLVNDSINGVYGPVQTIWDSVNVSPQQIVEENAAAIQNIIDNVWSY